MSGDYSIEKPGRMLSSEQMGVMWKGKRIWPGNEPIDFKLYHEHDRLTAKGWFPGDDLGGPPRVIPWQLWQNIDFVEGVDNEHTAQLPDGGHILGFHIVPTESKDDSRQGELPLDTKPAGLLQSLIDRAGGKKHKQDDYRAAAIGYGATWVEADAAYRSLPSELKYRPGKHENGK
jgi:hypothetical protein